MDRSFVPKRVFFEPDALEYPLGEELKKRFSQMGVEIKYTSSHNRVIGIPGSTPQEAYMEGKRTLVVGIRRSMDFQTCKPSAHYQLPLVTSCPGKCQYCYLATNLGKKPYIRVYVNIEEILERAAKYIEKHSPEVTVFEGAATSDPIPVEIYTGALKKTIEFFGRQRLGKFRFVTKYTAVDSLLDAAHNNHTRFRFSINSAEVIKKFEQGTPRMLQRIKAAEKVARAGYPLGFIIGPIFVHSSWQESYTEMLTSLAKNLPDHLQHEITFELITHRFTKRAKDVIGRVFPNTDLDMDEETRTYKYGQFGYGKYIYPKETMQEVKDFFTASINEKFPFSRIEYFV
ncbi:spore photoproduct lyase [Desulfofalx alkaliphila]|uniref:spore photoproduct lyase n=1 Tax=Desulfofalx alkaliphila TaxID=105483 RepID=UPI0004E26EDA|nr:spore photoproduct lyase [Desulfofalx alkaliphila]